MKSFIVLSCLIVAIAAHGHVGHHHHIPSGSVAVSHDGAVIAGPSGSIHTDNGLHGHGAGARLSGPAGDVRTHGGHATLHGPGVGHHGHDGHHGDGGNWGHVVGHGLGHHVIGHGLIAHGHGHHGW